MNFSPLPSLSTRSGFWISNSPVAAVIGYGGPGARSVLWLSTYNPLREGGDQGNFQIVAIDQGGYTAKVQFKIIERGSATNPLNTIFELNPDGTLAAPTMPGLPQSGTVDLTIDSRGQLVPQSFSSAERHAKHEEAIAKLQSEVSELRARLGERT